jgi:hypothetical protein
VERTRGKLHSIPAGGDDGMVIELFATFQHVASQCVLHSEFVSGIGSARTDSKLRSEKSVEEVNGQNALK